MPTGPSKKPPKPATLRTPGLSVREGSQRLWGKVSPEEKGVIETAIADLKSVLDSDNVDAIKEKTQALATVSQKLAEEMYKSQSADGGGDAEPSPGSEGSSSGGTQTGDVEDADYEVVDEDK